MTPSTHIQWPTHRKKAAERKVNKNKNVVKYPNDQKAK